MNIIGLKNDSAGVQKVEPQRTETATHTAVIFVLDTSGSMAGDSIKSLNDAINRFPQDVCANNNFARSNIEIAVMAFSSSVHLVSDWKPLGNYTPVFLTANGGTNIGVALRAALQKVKDKLNSSAYKTAHIVLISDGYGGNVDDVAEEIAQMKAEGKLVFWMLGVPGYDNATAQQLTHGEHLYTLTNGQHFNYSDFIKILMSSVIKMQSAQNPELMKAPELKGINISVNKDNKTGNGISGGFFSNLPK